MKEKKNKTKNPNNRNTKIIKNSISNNGKNIMHKKNKDIKIDSAHDANDRTVHRRFIFDGIEK